jgi:hypothetical protein
VLLLFAGRAKRSFYLFAREVLVPRNCSQSRQMLALCGCAAILALKMRIEPASLFYLDGTLRAEAGGGHCPADRWRDTPSKG